MAESGAVATAGDDAFLNKFSRQNAALGAEVTMKMTKMKALVVGCTGVAVEVTKNLILQGIGGITLCDSKVAKIADLGVNFFLSEADVGKKLAPTLAPKFKELNPFCDVKAVDSLTTELVSQHAVMVVCDQMPLSELVKWNNYCRTATPKSIAFVMARTGGVFGDVFVDFGASHVVVDDNGQQPMVRLVQSIEKGKEALVRLTVPDGQTPGTLPEGCYVEFSDLKGCTGLCEHQEAGPTGEMVTAWKVTIKPDDAVNTIRIGDTTGFPDYISGGLMTEKKVGRPCPFKSFAETMKDPGCPFDKMVGTDMINFGSELQSHLALHAVMALEDERQKPLAAGEEDVAAVMEKAKALLSSKESALEVEPDEEFFKKFVRHFHVPLQPFCAFLGGVVAQEVVKIAGKFTPIPGLDAHQCSGVAARLAACGLCSQGLPLRFSGSGLRPQLRREAWLFEALHGWLRRFGLRIYEELRAERLVLR